MSLIADLMMAAAVLTLFGPIMSIVMLSFGPVDPEELLWSFLPATIIAVALFALAGMINSGSKGAYMITLVLVALVITLNLMPLLEGDLFSLIYVCIGAAIIIYLADPDIRDYFFP